MLSASAVTTAAAGGEGASDASSKGPAEDASAAATTTAAAAAAAAAAAPPVAGSYTLETLKFDNRTLRSLPIDLEEKNFVREVAGACFSRVKPAPVERPVLVCSSSDALALIGLDASQADRPEFAKFFGGCEILPGSEPAAHCYCGHQFGYFAGQLGDGAAMYLGEVVNPQGDRWEIQLKGAGPTPYSRSADGRKVLRSSIREFLCSEAMHYLHVPTTRAGSIVTSDTKVIRDIFYSGNPIQEKASIVLRIAPTFLRFGSFEIFKKVDSESGRSGPSNDHEHLLFQLLDYTIEAYFPDIHAKFQKPEERYVELFKNVCESTAKLVARWQSVGFCHGVLNTDNMSILGLTIDYGPYAFLDRYNPDHICNGSDDSGRYAFKNQPDICKWNVAKFGEAITAALPLEIWREELKQFTPIYDQEYLRLMREKVGLCASSVADNQRDVMFIKELLDLMEQSAADYTNTFRVLCDFDPKNPEAVLPKLLAQRYSVETLRKSVKLRIDPETLTRIMRLFYVNPRAVLSQGLTPQLLQEEMRKLDLLTTYEDLDQADLDNKSSSQWKLFLQKYAAILLEDNKASGLPDEEISNKRQTLMKSSSPAFILRNHVAQQAIERAEGNDFSEVRRTLERLKTPFDGDAEALRPPPVCNDEICVTCSS